MTTPKAKPFKLKPTDGVMTRDDVALWEYTLLAACRQLADWQQFLPGGGHSSWTATDDDPTNGLTNADAAVQTKLRNDFANYLTCVATHCPTGFMDTVMRESTSFKAIIDQIKKTYGLDSKGEKFLSIIDIKLEFSPTFTYDHGYLEVRDFCQQSLLPSGTIFKTKARAQQETLSPLAENFIMKEFLVKVHPKLPDHIKNTKGHLFTNERPTLACNKAILIDMMDSMLAEIEAADAMTAGNISVAQMGRPPPPRGGRGGPPPRFPYRGQTNFRGPPRGFPRGGRPPFPVRPSYQAQGRGEADCTHCVEARMFDSSKGHTYRDCPFRLGLATPYQQSSYQRRPQSNNGMKILLLQDPSFQDQQIQDPQAVPSYQNLPLQEVAPSDQSYYGQPQYSYMDTQAEPYYDSYAANGYGEGYYDHAYPPNNSQL